MDSNIPTSTNTPTDTSELRSILKQLGSLPESSQEIIKSGVNDLLKNEEEKISSLRKLKTYLEESGMIVGNTIKTSLIQGNEEAKSKLRRYYSKYYADHSENINHLKYEESLIILQEQYNLEIDTPILSGEENAESELVKKLGIDIKKDNTFSYEKLLLLQGKNGRYTRKLLLNFSKKYLQDNSYITGLKYILLKNNIVYEENIFNKEYQKGKELQTKLTQKLKELGAKRLNLKNKRQKIAQSDVAKFESESGILCVLNNGVYQKINAENKLPFLVNVKNNGITQGIAETIQQFHLTEIKLSDLGQLKMHTTSLGHKNALPMHNNTHITVPSKIKYNGTEYTVDTNTAKTLIINQNTIAFYDDGYCFLIDTSNNTGKKQLLGTNGFTQRAKEYNPVDYIKQKTTEEQPQYSQRLMNYTNFNFLPEIYRDILDNAYFELQQYPLEEQMSFAAYYNSLEEKNKDIIKKLLKTYGENMFYIFKVCEADIHNGNLILEVLEQHGEQDSLKIFDKILYILDILKHAEFVEENGGDSNSLYWEILKKSIKALDDASDADGLLQALEQIENGVLEQGILFKQLKDKSIDSIDDLHRIGINPQIMQATDIDSKEKHKVVDSLMKLYEYNYSSDTQTHFLTEIRTGLNQTLEHDTKIYNFYDKNTLLLSCYVQTLDENNVYIGGLNENPDFKNYGFGFWVANKILKEHKDKNRQAQVLTNIEGIDTKNGSILLRKYKSMGANIGEQGESDTTQYTNITWEKDINTDSDNI